MSELLAFSNVVSGYGDARILHDVDLTIGDGERVAVLGRNGVGKTTIVNTFLGVARLSGGEVRLAGERHSPIRHFMAARRGIAVVPQGRRIIPTLTVRENLVIGGATGREQALDPRPRVRLVSCPARAGQHAGYRIVGRPAADAGDRARPDVEPLSARTR